MNYKELEQEVKRLEEQITNLRIKLLESKAEKKTYEVEFPEGLEKYYILDEVGRLSVYTEKGKAQMYIRGLTFKTEEEAKQFDKERILLFKLHKWAEEHNGGWKPDWEDFNEEKYIIVYDYDCEKFFVYSNFYYADISKLPLFKTNEIAEQFIEEFGDEIKEVLC